ncbi:MAG: phytanoyl-CoA dioxygenase family protein [Capsulimonadales bacterium]|nr:phytanoyl-CoA dioxygenase family protein [Capsulimonadales bacterium]
MEDPIRRNRVTPEEREFYATEGYVLLPGLLTTSEAEALRLEVLSIMEVIGLGRTKLRQTHEYLAGSRVDALVNSENLRRIASELMEGEAHLYLPFTAVKSGAETAEQGGGEFHFHQDNQYTRFDAPGNNLWFALTPMSEENGCLRMIPRSHLHGTLPSLESPDRDGHRTIDFAPESFLPIRMEPGDCVAFTRLTVHGSGPNRTSDHRVAYAVQYFREDVRYSTDGGVTWKRAKDHPRWSVGPVSALTPPTEKRDGH